MQDFVGILLGVFTHSTQNLNMSSCRGRKWKLQRKLLHLMERPTITWLSTRVRMNHPHMGRGKNSTKVDVKKDFCLNILRKWKKLQNFVKKIFFCVRNFSVLPSTFDDLHKNFSRFCFSNHVNEGKKIEKRWKFKLVNGKCEERKSKEKFEIKINWEKNVKSGKLGEKWKQWRCKGESIKFHVKKVKFSSKVEIWFEFSRLIRKLIDFLSWLILN